MLEFQTKNLLIPYKYLAPYFCRLSKLAILITLFIMKSIQLIFTTVTILVLLACSDAPTDHTGHNAAAATAKNKEDSLYNEVIALHDETMPKIGKLMGYQKTAQAKIDSLNQYLTTHKDEMARSLKADYDSLLFQLKAAEKGMNDWMDGFEPDPKMPNKEDIVKYFEDQKAKAQKMKDDIFVALDSASAKLDPKVPNP